MKSILVAAVLAASPAFADEEAITIMPVCRDGAVVGVRLIIREPVILHPQMVDLVPPPALCKGGDA